MNVSNFKVILLATISAVFLSISVFGQSGATIVGQVTDQMGAVIPGATVTLIASQREFGKTNTNGEGEFKFPSVQQGTYQLTVKWSGVNRVLTKTVNVIDSRSKQVNVTIDLSPCAGVEGAKSGPLTDTDRAEIVRQLITFSMENTGNIDAQSSSKVADFILVTDNIRSKWLTVEQRRWVKIMTRDEVQQVTEKFGELNYLRIMPLKQHGACIEATVTMNNTVKGQMEDANMSGGGLVYEFFKVAGRWVGKAFSAWVV